MCGYVFEPRPKSGLQVKGRLERGSKLWNKEKVESRDGEEGREGSTFDLRGLAIAIRNII